MLRLLKELGFVKDTCRWDGLIRYLWYVTIDLPTLIRTRSLSYADEKWIEAMSAGWKLKVFSAFGMPIALPPKALGLVREIYGRKVYFRPGFELQKGDVVVDLGANIGVFTILAAKLGCRVIALEAQSGFVEELKKNCQLNLASSLSSGSVIPVFGVIGQDCGLFSNPANLTSATHYQEAPPALNMKDLIAQHGLKKIDFLKIDIEGSEYSLFGGEDTPWLSIVDKIVMEVHTEFGNPEDIALALTQNGFEVELVSAYGKTIEAVSPPGGFLFAQKANPQAEYGRR